MKKLALTLSAAALTAGCIPPEGVTQEDLLLWDAAVASIGCDLVDETDYLPVELQTGLPREKVIEVAEFKVSQREAANLTNGGVRLMTGTCAPPEPEAEPTPAPAEA